MIKVFTLIIVFAYNGNSITSQELQYPTLESCNKIKDFYINNFWDTPRKDAYVRHASCVVSFI